MVGTGTCKIDTCVLFVVPGEQVQIVAGASRNGNDSNRLGLLAGSVFGSSSDTIDELARAPVAEVATLYGLQTVEVV